MKSRMFFKEFSSSSRDTLRENLPPIEYRSPLFPDPSRSGVIPVAPVLVYAPSDTAWCVSLGVSVIVVCVMAGWSSRLLSMLRFVFSESLHRREINREITESYQRTRPHSPERSSRPLGRHSNTRHGTPVVRTHPGVHRHPQSWHPSSPLATTSQTETPQDQLPTECFLTITAERSSPSIVAWSGTRRHGTQAPSRPPALVSGQPQPGRLLVCLTDNPPTQNRSRLARIENEPGLPDLMHLDRKLIGVLCRPGSPVAPPGIPATVNAAVYLCCLRSPPSIPKVARSARQTRIRRGRPRGWCGRRFAAKLAAWAPQSETQALCSGAGRKTKRFPHRSITVVFRPWPHAACSRSTDCVPRVMRRAESRVMPRAKWTPSTACTLPATLHPCHAPCSPEYRQHGSRHGARRPPRGRAGRCRQ